VRLPTQLAQSIDFIRNIGNFAASVVTAGAGGSRQDIVCLRLYILGEHIHNARSVREALLGFFPAENLPTSTWIEVSALASKDFLIEIEAVAVLE